MEELIPILKQHDIPKIHTSEVALTNNSTDIPTKDPTEDKVLEDANTHKSVEEEEEEWFQDIPTDEEMFPGYQPKTDIKSRENEIVAKHIQDGGIFSTFKTKDVIIAKRNRVYKRKEVESVNNQLRKTDSEVEKAIQKLENARSIVMASYQECTQIANELRHVIAEKHPRYGRKMEGKPFRLPPENLLLSNRGLVLKAAYEHHATVVESTQALIPALENQLTSLELRLSTLQIRQAQLIPVVLELQQADMEERGEQQAIASYRAEIEAISAIHQVEHIQEAKMEKEASLEREEMKRRQVQEALSEHQKLTRKRIHEQQEKMRKEMEDSKAAMKYATSKRQMGLTALSEAVAGISSKPLSRDDARRVAEMDPITERQRIIAQASINHATVRAKQTARKERILKLVMDEEKKIRKRRTKKRTEHGIQGIHASLQKSKPIDADISNERVETADKSDKEHAPWISEEVEGLPKEEDLNSPLYAGTTPISADSSRRRQKLSNQSRPASPAKSNYSASRSSVMVDRPEAEIGLVPLLTPGIRSSMENLFALKSKNQRIPLPPPRHVVKATKQMSSSLRSPPFTPNLQKVVFIDYIPGQVYEKTVVLTNTSSRVNCFRLQHIPLELQEYYELSHIMAGKLSAGLTWTITVRFSAPSDDTEIVPGGKIIFAAEVGGEFYLHVESQKRKCCPMVESYSGPGLPSKRFERSEQGPSEGQGSAVRLNEDNKYSVPFGMCSIGESIVRTIHFVNEGVLETDFEVIQENDDATESTEVDKVRDQQTPRDHSREVFKIVRNPSGRIGSYARNSVTISFSPPLRNDERLGSSSQRTSSMCSKMFRVAFDREEVPPVFLYLQGEALDSAVHMDKNVLDFGVCVVGCWYRDTIVLRNRGGIALKYTAAVDRTCTERTDTELVIDANPSNLPSSVLTNTDAFGDVEISPRLGFVQPGEPCNVWFRLKPSLDEYTQLEASDSSDGPPSFRIPLKISVHQGNHPPLQVELTGKVTRADISFLPRPLDFGFCSVYESAVIPVTITNHSHLIQKVVISSGIEPVKTNSGSVFTIKSGFEHFAMLPSESISTEVIFTPIAARKYNSKLVCRTNLNHRSDILCSGTGVRSPIKVSANHIIFPNTTRGSSATARINLMYDDEAASYAGGKLKSSREDRRFSFHFGQPELLSLKNGNSSADTTTVSFSAHDFASDRYLKATPRNGELGRNESVSIELTFHPPTAKPAAQQLDDGETPPGESVDPNLAPASAEIKKSKAEDASDGKKTPLPSARGHPSAALGPRSAAAQQSKSRVSTPTTARKAAPSELVKTTAPKAVHSTDPSFSMEDPTFVFGLACAVKMVSNDETSPVIGTLNLQITVRIVEPNIQLVEPSGGKLDFEHVPLGQQSVKLVVVRNVSARSLKLRLRHPDPIGPFSVANASREIKPGSDFALKVAFCPLNEGIINDSLEIGTSSTQIAVRMAGFGIVPIVIIEPRNGTLNMGDALVNEPISKTLKIHNPCAFPISYRLFLSDVVSKKQKFNGIINFNGINPFVCSPTGAIIPPGVRQEITVRFRPDRESLDFRDEATIIVNGQQTAYRLTLHGRAHGNTMFVTGFDQSPSQIEKNTWLLPPAVELELASKVDAAQAESGGDKSSPVDAPHTNDPGGNENRAAPAALPPRHVTVRCAWRRSVDGTFQVEMPENLAIVNTKTNAKSEAKRTPVGEFVIEPIAQSSIPSTFLRGGDARTALYNFQIEPLNGTVEVGTKKVLKVQLVGVASNLLLGDANPGIPAVVVGENTSSDSDAAVSSGSAQPAIDATGSAPINVNPLLASAGSGVNGTGQPNAASSVAPSGSASKKNTKHSGAQSPIKKPPIPQVNGNVVPVRIQSSFKITLKNGLNVVGAEGTRTWIVTIIAEPQAES